MISPKPLTEPLHCLTCEAEIEHVADLQNSRDRVHKNQIIICGHCAALHKVGDSDLIKFSREDFGKLDDQSKHLIAMTVMSILKKNKQENQ